MEIDALEFKGIYLLKNGYVNVCHSNISFYSNTLQYSAEYTLSKSQQRFTCSNSTIETLEKCVKHVQS